MTDPFNPLYKYAEHILTRPVLSLRPPYLGIHQASEGVEDDKVCSVILDRQGRFQTELFIIPPAIKEIRQHVHPGIDSFEFHISGDFTFTVSGESFPNKSDGLPLRLRDTLQQVDQDAWHGGDFNQGGSFLSFQLWHLQDPTSVGDCFVEEAGAKPSPGQNPSGQLEMLPGDQLELLLERVQQLEKEKIETSLREKSRAVEFAETLAQLGIDLFE
jgi:hypothetical protein